MVKDDVKESEVEEKVTKKSIHDEESRKSRKLSKEKAADITSVVQTVSKKGDPSIVDDTEEE